MQLLSLTDFSSAEAMWRNGSGTVWGDPSSSTICPVPEVTDDQYQYSYARGMFPCPKCNKVYQYKYTLNTHLRFECGKEPQFHCPYCPHRSKLKGNLMKHVRKIHANLMGAEPTGTPDTSMPNLGVQMNQPNDMTMLSK